MGAMSEYQSAEQSLSEIRDRARPLMASGRWDLAYLCYRDLMRSPDPEVWLELGRMLVAGGLFLPAQLRFERALRLAPGHNEVARAIAANAPQVAAFLQGTPPPRLAPCVSAVMLTWNCWDVTARCLQQLLLRSPELRELIVVDNGSQDETPLRLRELQQAHPELVRLVLNPENRGFAAGCNQGAALASSEYVLFLNNDVLVTQGWLARLILGLRGAGADLAGPAATGVSGPQDITEIDPHIVLETDIRECYAQLRGGDFAGRGRELNRLQGFGILLRREVLERIGGFDPRFGIGNFEDDDLCLRARLAGFRLWYEPSSYLHHFGQVSFRAARLDYAALLRANWRRFRAKWELLEAFPDDGHWDFDAALAAVMARPKPAADLYLPLG